MNSISSASDSRARFDRLFCTFSLISSEAVFNARCQVPGIDLGQEFLHGAVLDHHEIIEVIEVVLDLGCGIPIALLQGGQDFHAIRLVQQPQHVG